MKMRIPFLNKLLSLFLGMRMNYLCFETGITENDIDKKVLGGEPLFNLITRIWREEANRLYRTTNVNIGVDIFEICSVELNRESNCIEECKGVIITGMIGFGMSESDYKTYLSELMRRLKNRLETDIIGITFKYQKSNFKMI